MGHCLRKVRRISKTKIFAYFLIMVNFLLVVSSYKTAPYSRLLSSHDSTMFMYFGRGMQHGLVPYNDMFDHKGIVLFAIEWLGALAGGGQLTTGIWVLECLFYLVTLVFIWKTLKLLKQDDLTIGFAILFLTAPMIAAVAGGNFSEEYAVTFISIGLYLFTRIVICDDSAAGSLFFVGVTGALTFFLRANMISLWVVFICYLLVSDILRKRYRLLLRQFLLIFSGGIAVCLLVGIYALFAGNLHEMIYQTFILNIMYSRGTASTDYLPTLRYFWQFSLQSGMTMFILICTVVLIHSREIPSRLREFYSVAYLYVALNALTIVMSGRAYQHYFLTMIPIFPIFISISLSALKKLSRSRVTNGLVLLLIFLPTITFTHDALKTWVKPIITQTTFRMDDLQRSEASYIEANSNHDDTIYVHNIDANLYLLSNRYANSKYFTLPSLNYLHFPNLRSNFSKCLEEQPPKYIAMNRIEYFQKNPNDARLDKTVVNFVNTYYRIVPNFADTGILLFTLK